MRQERVRVTVETDCDCETPCGWRHIQPLGRPKAYVTVFGVPVRVPERLWWRLAERGS